MYIFQKRPLSLILCILLCGFFVFSTFEGAFRYLPIAIAPLLLIVGVIITPMRRRYLVVLLSALALIVSSALSYIYFDLYFKAYERFEGRVSIEATVLSITPSTEYSSKILVKSTEVNGEDFSSYKFVIWLSKDDFQGIGEGDRISYFATLSGFDSKGEFDSRQYYFSDGISASCENVEELTLIESGAESLDSVFEHLREVLRRRIILLSDEDSGNLLSALLTGERDELSSDLRQSFRRIGISHVLALSGMHLSILAFAINFILKLLFVNKRLRSVAVLLFSIAYMFFVGFSVSVVRAGIMLIFSSVMLLIGEDSDSINGLSIAVFLICLFTPYAIYDIALWLSAFATLGVIVSVRQEEEEKATFGRRILRAAKDSLRASVYAVGATLLVSVYGFGGFSVLSPLSTLIFSLLIEFYMYLGSVMLLFGLIFSPLATPFSIVLKLTAQIINELAALLESADFVYLSANFTPLLISVIVFTALLILLFIIKVNKRIATVITASALTLVFAFGIILNYNEFSRDKLIYSREGKADMFLVSSGGETALISSSQYSKAVGYDALNFLEANHITTLDKYVITHYSYSIEDDLSVLLPQVSIKEVFLPHPRNKAEENIYKRLLAFMEDYRAEISLHTEGGNIFIGNFSYNLLYSHPYDEGSSKNAFLFTYKSSEKYLYLSSGMVGTAFEESYSQSIPSIAGIIYGTHGQKYKEDVYLDHSYDRLRRLVISGENIYLTQSSYSTYVKNGCEITSHPKTVDLINVKIKR